MQIYSLIVIASLFLFCRPAFAQIYELQNRISTHMGLGYQISDKTPNYRGFKGTITLYADTTDRKPLKTASFIGQKVTYKNGEEKMLKLSISPPGKAGVSRISIEGELPKPGTYSIWCYINGQRFESDEYLEYPVKWYIQVAGKYSLYPRIDSIYYWKESGFFNYAVGHLKRELYSFKVFTADGTCVHSMDSTDTIILDTLTNKVDLVKVEKELIIKAYYSGSQFEYQDLREDALRLSEWRIQLKKPLLTDHENGWAIAGTSTTGLIDLRDENSINRHFRFTYEGTKRADGTRAADSTALKYFYARPEIQSVIMQPDNKIISSYVGEPTNDGGIWDDILVNVDSSIKTRRLLGKLVSITLIISTPLEDKQLSYTGSIY